MADDENLIGLAIGRRMREIRNAKGLSIRQFADLLGDGTHFTTVGKMETGKVRLTANRVEQLAKALGVTFADLVDPNFSLAQVRPVPVVTPGDWIKTGNARGAPIIGWITSPVGGPNSVAFLTVVKVSSLERELSGYSVVDLDVRTLMDENAYMIDSTAHDTLDLVVFKADPARFDILLGNRTEPFFLVGDRPFMTVGKVVFRGLYL